MPKFMVTMTLYQHCIVEAEDAQKASHIASYETNDDDWDDPVVETRLIVEPYEGDKEAFNVEHLQYEI